MPPACVCQASLLCAPQSFFSMSPSLSPQCLSASLIAPDQESGDPSPPGPTRALEMSLLMLLMGQAEAVCMECPACATGIPSVGMVALLVWRLDKAKDGC